MKNLKHGSEFVNDDYQERFVVKFIWFIVGFVSGILVMISLINEKPL